MFFILECLDALYKCYKCNDICFLINDAAASGVCTYFWRNGEGVGESFPPASFSKSKLIFGTYRANNSLVGYQVMLTEKPNQTIF